MQMRIRWILGFSMILIAINYLGCKENNDKQLLERVHSVWVDV